jgi:hypothetical protein
MLCVVSRNYVLQHVLGLHDPVCTESICFLLRGKYVLLSSQKGGSHVVEKCLNSPWMDYAIQDFINCDDRLWQLARDRYGNYVIQTALKATKVHFLNSIAFEISRFCACYSSSPLPSSGQAIPFYTLKKKKRSNA